MNDEDIRYLDGEQTPVGATDTLSIVPSVAGGSDAVAAGAAELPALTHDEVKRYSRHLIMPEVGVEGQQRLKAARVLCVGAGGLGSPASLYLAAAGVGTLGLVDFDVVDVSNLQRQILYGTRDVGRPKLDAARERLTALNPDVRVVTHEARLTSANALDIFSQDYDVVVDGADNFPTRYLVNDACVLLGKPNVYGSIFRFDGQASVFATKAARAIAACIPSRRRPDSCRAAPRAACSACCRASSARFRRPRRSRLILGAGQSLAGRLLLFDALAMSSGRSSCGAIRSARSAAITRRSRRSSTTSSSAASRRWRARRASRAEDETTVEELKARIDRGDASGFSTCASRASSTSAALPARRSFRSASCRSASPRCRAAGAPDIVVHCKLGGRSAKAVALLREHGFTRVKNLKGGILAWIEKIDPTLAKY